MANIIKSREPGIRDQIERHMKNSIEYTNPNLKGSSNFGFPPITEDELKIKENLKDIEDFLKIIPDKEKISITGIRVDKNYQGFITFKKLPFKWEEPEIKVEFTNPTELVNNFTLAI